MKLAYVSLVLVTSDVPSVDELRRIDGLLAAASSVHEIVVVPSAVLASDEAAMEAAVQHLTGPLTLIDGADASSREELVLTGIARAVGDFVLEWDAPPAALTADRLQALFDAVDRGSDLVEIPSTRAGSLGRLFLRTANGMRSGAAPMRSVAARLSSRRVIGDVLAAAGRVVSPHRLVLFADVRATRATLEPPMPHDTRPPLGDRAGEAVDVLLLGTKAGTRLPSLLAAVFAVIGLVATLYAVVVPLLFGRAPEGWTTILGFSGVAASGLFTVLALLSAQLRLSMRRPTGQPGGAVRMFAPWQHDVQPDGDG